MSLMVSVSGIRGIVGDTMTPAVVAGYAAAFATELGHGPIVLARDSRPSGAELASAATAAVCAAGCDVIDLGIVSTPGAALMVRQLNAAGGIVLTASHNPSPWNGLKFLTAAGIAPPRRDAEAIWRRQATGDVAVVDTAQRGRHVSDSTTHARHVDAVLARTDHAAVRQLRFKVVLDSVNGAGGASGRRLLEALGCEIVHLNAEPTGHFAHPPEPLAENLTDLARAVTEHDADVGFAQDPDADRLALVDDHGTYIGEEYTLALAARFLFAREPGVAVTNLSTSRMIDDIAAAAGGPCRVIRTAVGEANVVEGITSNRALFGGEGNGGVIDPQVVPVRDSLVAMGTTLQLMAREGRPLSSIVASLPRYTMIKQKFPCSPERIATVLDALRGAFPDARMDDRDGVRLDWDEGWVHARGSNTEPIMRWIAEAADRETATALLQRVADRADAL